MEFRDDRRLSGRDDGRKAVILQDLWRLASGQHLASWGWDDEFVVYNNLSGDTHLLDGDSMALLEQLRSAPASIDALVAAFVASVNPDDAAALPETILSMLGQLNKLHLVTAPELPC